MADSKKLAPPSIGLPVQSMEPNAILKIVSTMLAKFAVIVAVIVLVVATIRVMRRQAIKPPPDGSARLRKCPYCATYHEQDSLCPEEVDSES